MGNFHAKNNSEGDSKGIFYEDIPKPTDNEIEEFHLALYWADKDKVINFLKKYPILCNTPDSKGFSPVISAISGYRQGKTYSILHILKSSGTDFNYLSPKSGDLPCAVTPLAYCIFNAPHFDDAINDLIYFGGDVNHSSITEIIDLHQTETYVRRLEHIRFGSRQTINRILKLQGKPILPPSYQPNKLNLISPIRELKKKNYDNHCLLDTSELSDLYYPRKLVGLRYGPSSYQKDKNVLSIYVAVYDLNDAVVLINQTASPKPINTEVFEIKRNITQKLIFSVLTGILSPLYVFSLLKGICDSKLMKTVIGRFLYMSVGHESYLSPNRLRVIDSDLEKSFGEKIGYSFTNGFIITNYLINNFEIPYKFPTAFKVEPEFNFSNPNPSKLNYSIMVDNNVDFYPSISHCQPGCGWLPGRVTKIILNSEFLEIYFERQYSIDKFKSHAQRFESYITKQIIVSILIGEKSPNDCFDILRKIGGYDICHTNLGKFLFDSPGFGGKTDEKRQIVDDKVKESLMENFGYSF